MNYRLEELRSELENVLGFECVLVKLETYNNDVDEHLSLKAKLEQASKALNLAIKHISGKAEIFSEREKTPVLHQLNECLKSIQGEG